jgi:hypothetical protein
MVPSTYKLEHPPIYFLETTQFRVLYITKKGAHTLTTLGYNARWFRLYRFLLFI